VVKAVGMAVVRAVATAEATVVATAVVRAVAMAEATVVVRAVAHLVDFSLEFPAIHPA
jgi:hypothetical protein